MVHGEWEKWCREEIKLSPQRAWEFMKIYNENYSNLRSVGDLGFTKLLEIAALPDSQNRQEFIDSSHKIPSTGETKNVDEMTVRELREVKKALKEANEKGNIL